MMRQSAIYLSCLILLLTSFCSVEEPLPEPNIYAVLSTDSSRALVLVGEVLQLGDTFSVDTMHDWDHYSRGLPWKGVSDTEVKLKRGEEIFVLEEMQDSAGYYYTDSLAFAPGEEWELEVDYPDERYVQARTQIPGSFEIISPLTDTLNLEDTLKWTSSQNAAGYALVWFCWGTHEYEDSLVYWSRLNYGWYYPAEIRYLPLDYYFSYYDSVEFYIAALDSNYYKYRKSDSKTLDDAWGVFGSQMVVKSRRYIIPPPDTAYPPVSRCTKACLKDGDNW